ncbi:MAG: TolC family protein [Gemmatimonadetes bacterium]|nr:TolC family protein [Gemmatimonadota bacterium]
MKLVGRRRRTAHRVRAAVVAWALAILAPGTGAEAQTGGAARPISLSDAIRTAGDQSEQITMARAAVLRAQGQQMQSRSELYPQLSTSFSYNRALASQFEGAFGGPPSDTTAPPLPPCQGFVPDPALPLEQRVRMLEGQFNCAAPGGGGLDFANLPFGRENTYQLGLSFSQNLFAGGRIAAQNRVARAGVETAEIALRQAEAQLSLDITQAYYDAVLSDQLLAIARATLDQSEATLRQAALAREVGTQPEFELLRAQVTRDDQRPVVIQRQADRDLAYLRLRQLLNIPADEPIQLTSELREGDLPSAIGESAASDAPARAAAPAIIVDTMVTRSAVDQALQAVTVQEALVAVAESQRRPNLMLVSQYGRVAYPTGFIPTLSESRQNWNVGFSLSVPILTGGRLRGVERVAEANLLESRARLQQVRELASLDTRSAYQQLASAQAAWEASSGTVEQAQRAYQIAEVRYREGISTQVELSDSRILLQQAQANRASAARNLQVARARVTLLPNLPLGGVGAGGQQGPAQEMPPQGQQAGPQQQPAGGSFPAMPGMGGL